MYTYKRFKTSKSVLTIVLIALALAAWGVWELTDLALASHKEKHSPGGGGGERTALVTISGPMQTEVPQIFGLKDSNQRLILNRGS